MASICLRYFWLTFKSESIVLTNEVFKRLLGTNTPVAFLNTIFDCMICCSFYVCLFVDFVVVVFFWFALFFFFLVAFTHGFRYHPLSWLQTDFQRAINFISRLGLYELWELVSQLFIKSPDQPIRNQLDLVLLTV